MCEKFEVSVVFMFCFLILLNYVEYKYEYYKRPPHEISPHGWNIPLFLSIKMFLFIQPQKPLCIREIFFYFIFFSPLWKFLEGFLSCKSIGRHTHTYTPPHRSREKNVLFT